MSILTILLGRLPNPNGKKDIIKQEFRLLKTEGSKITVSISLLKGKQK